MVGFYARWVLRPILWFATASIATTVLHELAHASAAFALGVRSVLFNYRADVDLTAEQAATNAPVLIAAAGPTFCLLVGMLSWFAFRRTRRSGAELPLLYLSVFGIATFFGNLMSTALVGDFSAAAVALRLPMALRLAIAIVGALSLAAIHFWAGRELIRRVPQHVGRGVGTLGIVTAAVLGTAAVILVNQPMPAAFASARAAEGAFWLFAAIGALVTRRGFTNGSGVLGMRGPDAAAALVAILVVRLLVRGIPFEP